MNFDQLGRIELSDAVQLRPYVPREPLHYEIMSDLEIFAGAGGTLIIDIEAYPNYFLIAFKDLKTGKVIIFENCDKEHMRKLCWIMQSYRTVGFNSNKYDIPLIWMSQSGTNVATLKEASNQLIFDGLFSQALQTKFNFKIYKTNHVDLIEVCPLTGSLKLYGARLHSQRIQELPFLHDQDLTHEQIAIVRDYCINDLGVTELIYNNLHDQLALRATLGVEYRQDLMSKSDAQIAEAVICGKLKRLTGKWPQKPKQQVGNTHTYKPPAFIQFLTERLQKLLVTISNAQYEVLENGRVIVPKEIENADISIGNGVYRIGNGGLHSSEKGSCVKSDANYFLFDRDVASYYPAIILNCGLFPQHLGSNFLTVYRALVERRLAAKKAKNTAIAEALKITINGTFGKLGSPYSVLYAPDLMIQVTVTGQLALLMLIEMLEGIEISVVSANTDGIMIKCNRNRIIDMRLCIEAWERKTKFITEETEYAALYSRDVNAYLAVKKDGTSKGKNIYYDPWNSKEPKDLIWRFFKNPNAQICTEAVIKLVTQNVPIEKTIRDCKDITRFVCVKNVTGGAHKDGHYLGKVIRWYYSSNIYGTINYIKNNNKVPDSEKGRPCMDLPLTFPDDIAYDIYIKRTIDMLEEMAYYQKNKQIAFF